MALFIIMPFLGGWIGYTYAPEKVVEREVVSIQKPDNLFGLDSESVSELDKDTRRTYYAIQPGYLYRIFNRVEYLLDGSTLQQREPSKYYGRTSDLSQAYVEKEFSIQKPESLRHIAYGLFSDGEKLYNTLDAIYKPELHISPTSSVAMMSAWGREYMFVDDLVYFVAHDQLSVVLIQLHGVDRNSVSFLMDGYVKDLKSVYYLSDNPWEVARDEVQIVYPMDGAHPASFQKILSSMTATHPLYKDDDSVYFDDTLLTGIDPETMVIEARGQYLTGTVVYDQDGQEIWFDRSGCDGAKFEEGIFDDLATYEYAC